MMTTYGSICSGIEAATTAWRPLGMHAMWYSEIEPFPSAVLTHHYPNTPNLGDMTKLSVELLRGKITAPDILVGGTPCQAFSVAGMREGLADPRGRLTIKNVALVDAVAGRANCAVESTSTFTCRMLIPHVTIRGNPLWRANSSPTKNSSKSRATSQLDFNVAGWKIICGTTSRAAEVARWWRATMRA